ncbi:MAG: transketolase [Bacteroidetes bacterium]|nr:transketolase [Bacteroidota bacterium]
MKKIQELENIASQVRRDIVRMVADVSSGHPGGSLGCADLLTALYFNTLRIEPKNFDIKGKGEDLFFLSNGHISPVWYSVLSHRGFFPKEELATFRLLGSRLQGHPTPVKGIPGVRLASGSLGQGLANAIGYATAKKMDGDDKLVYVLMGDGETNEGQVWESAQYAGAKKIDNLIAIVDWNNQQIDGTCEDVLSLGDFPARWRALGWEIIDMNGNDMQDVVSSLEKAKEATGKNKPVIILMKTEMGFGVDFMSGTNAWHGKAPSQEQKAIALEQLKETLGDY